MFNQEATSMTQAPTPWYRSLAALAVVSILLPPLGIIMLWLRRDMDAQRKIAGTLCIAALAVGYLYFIFGVGRSRNTDSHYTELERHREEQKRQAPAETAAVPGSATQAVAPADANNQQAELVTPESGQSAGQPDAGAATKPATAPKSSRNYWTSFRGPGQDGRYEQANVKTKWSPEGLPLLWRQPIGGGYASFVVADGVAFTIEQRRNQEVVAAYQMENGRELWTHGWNAEFSESQGGDGPRATPTWDGGRLYALGATGEFRCLDAKTGKVIWSRNILSDNGASNISWGMAASPLIVDDKVIVHPGGRSGKSVVAYNKLTGAPIWKVLNDEASYTSPILVTLGGRRQILAVTASRAVGLAPEDGALLWETPWANSASINVSQPIVIDKNRFFISAGYGKGAALVEVTGSGKSFAARKVWENSSMKNKFNSSVLHNGYVYGLDEGILTCIDPQTGERKWKGGRYGYGQVLLASGHLIVVTEGGELVLVKASPDQHSEISRFSAIEGKTWNYPAIADGRLLVRNTTQMACFNLSAE